jgi:ABC-type amino acid transport system permease subunit
LGRIIFELGYVGFLFHLLTILGLYITVRKKISNLASPFWISIYRGWETIVLLFIFYIPYYPVSTSDVPAFTLWGLAGILLAMASSNKVAI